MQHARPNWCSYLAHVLVVYLLMCKQPARIIGGVISTLPAMFGGGVADARESRHAGGRGASYKAYYSHIGLPGKCLPVKV